MSLTYTHVMHDLALLEGKLFGYVHSPLMWILKIRSYKGDRCPPHSFRAFIKHFCISKSVVYYGRIKKKKTNNRKFHLTAELRLMMRKAGSGFGKMQESSVLEDEKLAESGKGVLLRLRRSHQTDSELFQVPGPATSKRFMNICPVSERVDESRCFSFPTRNIGILASPQTYGRMRLKRMCVYTW